MTVNQNLRILRKEKNITTTELAKRIGVSQSAVVRYENGTIKFIPVELLKKISTVLECSFDTLVDGDERYANAHQKRISSKSLSSEETNLIKKYRELPANVQNIVKEICDLHISGSN